MIENWLWSPILIVALMTLAALSLMAWQMLNGEKHFARDMGDGSIKVRCPQDDRERHVHLNQRDTLPCPKCGRKIRWPVGRRWSCVDEN